MLTDVIICLILLILMILFLPLIMLGILLIAEYVLCPFWEWYLGKLEKVLDKFGELK